MTLGGGSPYQAIKLLPGRTAPVAGGVNPEKDGRRRIAVNIRLAEPGAVAHLPIDHFDGLDSFDDLPRDARCVADMWF